jgi:hypothetical protein
MGVELSLETDAQFAKACDPGMRALDHPAMASEPFTALDAASCDAPLDAALA